MLKKLRDLGNTVVVVEHDTEMIQAADHLIELGPGPGTRGGQVVFEGPVAGIKGERGSLTGQYLAGRRRIEVPTSRRPFNGQTLRVVGARENNLKGIDVEIPLGLLVAITGVSGSGKSSLVNEVLYKRLYQVFRDRRIIPGAHERIEGLEHLHDVRNIDQSPIGRSSRSNPATYVGFFDKIRRLFAEVPEAQARGYTYRQFSFNNREGGRCLSCRGEGSITTKLQYMPDVESICPECKGARFTPETLEIRYRGKNMAQVLELTVEEAIPFFKDVRLIHHKLRTMQDLGLGYLKLGQSSNTLSGGEAQRIKLATELGKLKRKRANLYILDEPTTGLHLDDIKKLLACLNRLVEAGNTVLVIEHHLDVIKMADYVIDLGPEGGAEGGTIVAEGTPEQVAGVDGSYTGHYLRAYLNGMREDTTARPAVARSSAGVMAR
jgi:excinuclease ABC subunit A